MMLLFVQVCAVRYRVFTGNPDLRRCRSRQVGTRKMCPAVAGCPLVAGVAFPPPPPGWEPLDVHMSALQVQLSG